MAIMKTEEKQLLLKDLCARLPYHPKINICNDSWEGCQIGEFDNELWYHHIEAFNCDRIEIKPYLRPMSSMTEEEKKVFDDFCVVDEFAWNGNTEVGYKNQATIMSDGIDWLLSHHFDFRGLIPMGLALEAPKDMYKGE